MQNKELPAATEGISGQTGKWGQEGRLSLGFLLSPHVQSWVVPVLVCMGNVLYVHVFEHLLLSCGAV